MSKLTELQDARAAAKARQDRRMAEATQLCSKFAEAFAIYLEADREKVFFVKMPMTVDAATGEIQRDDAPLAFSDGELKTTLVVQIDDSVVFAPFVLATDPLREAPHVTVGETQAGVFDLRDGCQAIAEHLFASIKRHYENCDTVEATLII